MRQANQGIRENLSADQRKILLLSGEGYSSTEIARELALPEKYVQHFMIGMVQRLTHDHLIPSPAWKHVLSWAEESKLFTTS